MIYEQVEVGALVELYVDIEVALAVLAHSAVYLSNGELQLGDFRSDERRDAVVVGGEYLYARNKALFGVARPLGGLYPVLFKLL